MIPSPVAPRSDASGRPASGTAVAVLSQVAGWLLPGAPDIDPIRDETEAEALVRLATRERLLGPLLVSVDAGALVLPDDLVEQVSAGHQDAMLWCMHIEHRLLDVSDWFAAAGGIDFRVVKGPAVAHLDEPDPSLRAFADLDLLVRAEQFDEAIAALELHGAVRRVPQRRPGFDRRFNKSVGLTCADGVELDVHRTFTGGAHGFRIPTARLFEDPERFVVGGEEFLAPDLVVRALHAAYHAIVGSRTPPLRTLRDLAGYLIHPELGPEVLIAEVARWRGEVVLAEAVRATLAAMEFDAPAWQEWLDRTAVDPAELDLIARQHDPRGVPVLWSTLEELRGRERLAYLWAVAVPSREVLIDRGQTQMGRLKFGLNRILSGSGTARSRPATRKQR